MSIDPSAAAPRQVRTHGRLVLVDAARGVALLAMAIYHFSWDLAYFGYIAADVARDTGWVIFARAIATSFLFLVGVSLVLATRRGIRWRPYLMRLARLVAAATAITVVTYVVFPDAFIFFGILHLIAVASLLALPFLRLPVWLVALAAVAIVALPFLWSHPLFDHPALQWLGLMTYFPATNDYVPVFPWLGVVLLGTVAARTTPMMRMTSEERGARGERNPVVRGFARAGRHSLAIYLLHQPVLFGLVWVMAQFVPVPHSVQEARYLESCVNYCVGPAAEEALCRSACGCIVSRLEGEGLWQGVMTDSLSEPDRERYFGLAAECRSEAERLEIPEP